MTEATGWAARIAAGTPENRDRTADGLRAAAIIGVILGHWLVTAVVSDPHEPAALHIESPLTHLPGLIPVTWVLQTLGPFFFAGGYAAARSMNGHRTRPWPASRLRRASGSVLALALVWLPAMLLLTAVDTPSSTRQVVWTLVTQPLWFLLVYLVLTAFAPLLRKAVVRWGAWPTLPAAALVAVVDTIRPHGLPAWLALPAVPIGWAVPYLLGIALAEGRLPRRAGAVLLPLGAGGGTALVLLAGYPASAVGVPGNRWSNLAPPSLFALALTAAQLGAFLLLRPTLVRTLQRPSVWAPVAALNRTAMTLYCWHQPALLLVTFTGLLTGRPPGLLDTPTTTAWPWSRLLWLPGFTLALIVLARQFRGLAKPRRRPADFDYRGRRSSKKGRTDRRKVRSAATTHLARGHSRWPSGWHAVKRPVRRERYGSQQVSFEFVLRAHLTLRIRHAAKPAPIDIGAGPPPAPATPAARARQWTMVATGRTGRHGGDCPPARCSPCTVPKRGVGSMSGYVGWLSLRSSRLPARLPLWQMGTGGMSSLWCVRVWCCSTSLGRYRF
ncbi:acyltransferase [Amycolatopsis sp. NPDC051045]|uniref:acyltransferase family protein n=1 Tax=Amycolatopsis sp. NPDC051045 TaxID=3156922 RepID=UPI0034146785